MADNNADVAAVDDSEANATTAENSAVGQTVGEIGATREAFVVYKVWIDAINKLETDAEKLQMYEALMHYGFNGTFPQNANGICKMWITTIAPLMKSTKARYEANVKNGKKGGNPNFVKGQPNPYYAPKDNPNHNPELTQDNPPLPTDNLRIKNREDKSIDDNNKINNQYARACARELDESLWITQERLEQMVAKAENLNECFTHVDDKGKALPRKLQEAIESLRHTEHSYLLSRMNQEVWDKVTNVLLEPQKGMSAVFFAKQITDLRKYIISVLQNEREVLY